MNSILKHLLAVAVLATTFVSCVSEELIETDENKEGTSFSISTRGASDPLDPDNEIGKLRVIAFDQGGKVRSNKVYEITSLGQKIQHTIATGTYDFVFIANEPADLTTALQAIVNPAGLKSLSIEAKDIDRTKLIPQIQFIDDVEVLEENKVKHPAIGTGAATTDWALKLIRLAARIDVKLYAKTDLASAFKGVKLTKLPNRVPLVASGYTGTAITRGGTREYTTKDNLDCFMDLDLKPDTAWATQVVRLIVPFNEFTPANTAANAIGMTVLLHDQYNPSATMGLDDTETKTTDYTLPRNNRINAIGPR